MVNNEDIEYVKERIATARGLIEKGCGSDVVAYCKVLSILIKDYETIKETEHVLKYGKQLENFYSTLDISGLDVNGISDITLALRNAYDCMARCGDLESFMIAMEWNRPITSKFYIPRRRVLKHHGIVQALQRLIDRKTKMLVIECPPGIGKSVCGSFTFLYQYALHPERRSLMGGHTTSLCNGFFQDILDFIDSPEYRFREIFPEFPKIEKNAEYRMIYTERKKREPNLMFTSIEAGATGIIHVDGLLYVDDLIKNAEQARNPEQCVKVREAYTGQLQDRITSDQVPILVIGTRWSINDHISYLINKYENEPWFEHISVPCMNEARTESNFMYDFGLAKTVEHWNRLIRDDNEVIAAAKYFCIAIDEKGKVFTKDSLCYFNSLPMGEPDRIVSHVDVAYGGGDNYSMPIAYVYGRDVYILDVIYSKDNKDVTRPLTVRKIQEHRIQKVHFEGNNGGDLFADNVNRDLREQGFYCNITSSKVPTNKSKIDRILSVESEIKGKDTNSNTYRILFLAESKWTPEYRRFMQDIFNFSNDYNNANKKNLHDDAPDSVAGLILNVLGKQIYASVQSSCSRKSILI